MNIIEYKDTLFEDDTWKLVVEYKADNKDNLMKGLHFTISKNNIQLDTKISVRLGKNRSWQAFVLYTDTLSFTPKGYVNSAVISADITPYSESAPYMSILKLSTLESISDVIYSTNLFLKYSSFCNLSVELLI